MANSKALRRKARRKRLRVVVTLGILLVAGNMPIRSELPSLLWKIGMMAVKNHTIPISEEWNLIVVNRWNEIPENYSVTLTELENGQKVDSRIYPDLQEMFDAMRAEGIYPTVREGYRTAEEQQEILEERIQRYMNEVYLWLAENAYKYGFILRYPQGKEDITGAEYEPWHYRYVGTENAKIIYEKQICLEEFIESTES